jgi:protoheme IX farnesyltransferase
MSSTATLSMGEMRVTQRIRAHVAMTKPRIIELLLVTAIPTMFLAADGLPDLATAVAVLIGGAAAAGAANTFNSVYDRDIDSVMARTHDRPVALGLVSRTAGVVQGLILTAAAVVILAIFTTALAAALGLAAILLYSVGYTMILKRRTSQNIVWGGAAGCMPVLIAWAAITGSLTWTPVVLFLVVFFWTPPHYWPLAIKYRAEYQQAGIPMLPVVATDAVVARHIVIYSWVMVAVSLLLVPVAGMSMVYLSGAAVVGAIFLVLAYRVRAGVGTPSLEHRAMRLFHGSITYLAILFLLVGVDPFLRG